MPVTQDDFLVETMSWRPPELLLRSLCYFCHIKWGPTPKTLDRTLSTKTLQLQLAEK
jgi:hypothetical protein